MNLQCIKCNSELKDINETGKHTCECGQTNYVIICSKCGELCIEGSNETNIGIVCDKCYEEYEVCEICQEVIHETVAYTEKNHYICNDCTDAGCFCEDCGDFIKEGEEYWSDIEDKVYCETCYNNMFSSCRECDREIYAGATLCEDCQVVFEGGYGDDYIPIKGCSCGSIYNVTKEGFCKKCGNFLRGEKMFTFGIEIEMSDLDLDFEIPDELIDYFLWKQDTSTGLGSELVTSPLKWKEKKIIEEILEELNHYNACVSANEGLHIHIGGWNDFEHYCRFGELAKQTLPLWKSLTTFSRDEGSYTGKCCFTINKKEKSVNKHTRYADINPSSHGTWEIRKHQGTVNWKKIHLWIDIWRKVFIISQNKEKYENFIKKLEKGITRENFFKEIKMGKGKRRYISKRMKKLRSISIRDFKTKIILKEGE